jgi:hypothetical protein
VLALSAGAGAPGGCGAWYRVACFGFELFWFTKDCSEMFRCSDKETVGAVLFTSTLGEKRIEKRMQYNTIQ